MDKQVLQYVTDALRLCGQLYNPGSGPSPESIAEVTAFLNQMLDSWDTMRNAIYALSDLSYTLSSGKYIYTVGSGGDLNGPRPQKIQRLALIYQTSPQLLRLPIRQIDADEWAAVRVPNLPNAVPYLFYYDSGYSQVNPTGLATLYLWPGPMQGFGLEMWIWNTLPTTLLSTDTLFVPPGYARALTYNLAAEIMALYGKRLTAIRVQKVEAIARESFNWVMSLNAPSPVVQMPDELIGNRGRSNFNWLASTN